MTKVYAIKKDDKIEVHGVNNRKEQARIEAHLATHTLARISHPDYEIIYILDEHVLEEEEEEEE